MSSLLTNQFDYQLPNESIAQFPIESRDHSKLMVIDREKKAQLYKHFYNIVDYLKKGDLIVWNNSKVFKARLFGTLLSEKGEVLRDHTKPVEIFLIKPMENDGVWQVLAKPGKHVRVGTRIVFADDFVCETMIKEKDGTVLVQFEYDEKTVREKANKYGHIPIPPYVKDEPHELEIYQTVYADDTKEGSVAAPTAGFHFTPELIETLKQKGIEFAEVTLHVGLGTFLPVKTERVADHTMHSEWVEISNETAEAVNRAKTEGRRVIAVGTTTVRTLEGVALLQNQMQQRRMSMSTCILAYTGTINLFILPGFPFKIVDAMITNFHLPKSTLLMLVCAFVGNTDFVIESYTEAIHQDYRFYSFGDAMFIY